jgi:hypothetical protein
MEKRHVNSRLLWLRKASCEDQWAQGVADVKNGGCGERCVAGADAYVGGALVSKDCCGAGALWRGQPLLQSWRYTFYTL